MWDIFIKICALFAPAKGSVGKITDSLSQDMIEITGEAHILQTFLEQGQIGIFFCIVIVDGCRESIVGFAVIADGLFVQSHHGIVSKRFFYTLIRCDGKIGLHAFGGKRGKGKKSGKGAKHHDCFFQTILKLPAYKVQGKKDSQCDQDDEIGRFEQASTDRRQADQRGFYPKWHSIFSLHLQVEVKG